MRAGLRESWLKVVLYLSSKGGRASRNNLVEPENMECKYIGVLCQYLPYIPLHIPPIVSTYERSHKHKPQTLCLCGNRKIYTAMANSTWKSRKCYIVTYMLRGKCYIVTILCYVLIKLSELDIYYLSIQTMAPLVSNTKRCSSNSCRSLTASHTPLTTTPLTSQ